MTEVIDKVVEEVCDVGVQPKNNNTGKLKRIKGVHYYETQSSKASFSTSPGKERQIYSCLFCRIAQRVIRPSFGNLIYRDKAVCVFYSKERGARIHLLVVTLEHIKDVTHLCVTDLPLLRHMKRIGVLMCNYIQLAHPHFNDHHNPEVDVLSPARLSRCASEESEQTDMPTSPQLEEERCIPDYVDEDVDEVSGVFPVDYDTLWLMYNEPHDRPHQPQPPHLCFHAPPHNSIDHIHLHCLIKPFTWTGAMKYNSTLWATDYSVVEEGLRAQSHRGVVGSVWTKIKTVYRQEVSCEDADSATGRGADVDVVTPQSSNEEVSTDVIHLLYEAERPSYANPFETIWRGGLTKEVNK